MWYAILLTEDVDESPFCGADLFGPFESADDADDWCRQFGYHPSWRWKVLESSPPAVEVKASQFELV